MSAAVRGLADAVLAFGYAVPHHRLFEYVVKRVIPTGSRTVEYDAAQATRLLGERKMVALLGSEIRLLQRGFRAVVVIMTLDQRARGVS
jgi:hypothetical protein